MGRNQHVVRIDGGWAVKEEGNATYTSRHHTQTEAEEAAREVARIQGSEVVIHKPDGTIRDKDSYGPDPYSPRDTKH